jgi:putative tricarboxylic transport membrane protein
VVTLVASVGIFAISNSPLDLYFMIGFGLMGYLLRKLHIPLVPVILGMLLGPEMEKSLRHALTLSDGDWTILWSSGLAVGIWAVAITGLVLPYIVGPVLRRRMAAAQDKEHSIVD